MHEKNEKNTLNLDHPQQQMSSDHFTLVGWVKNGGWNTTQFFGEDCVISQYKDPVMNQPL